MFKFLRKITYSEELRRILEEEERLAQEWSRRWQELSYNIKRVSYFDRIFTGEDWFNQIWADLVALNTESRKLEEIKRLLEQEEKLFPFRRRRALKQLRQKLDWKPLKLKEYISVYELFRYKDKPMIRGEVAEEHEARYKSILENIVGREHNFWQHLNEEREKMQEIMVRQSKRIKKKKRIAQIILERIKSNKPNWWHHIEKFTKSGEYGSFMEMRDARGKNAYEWERDKRYLEGYFTKLVALCDNVEDFLQRISDHLKDIGDRLMRIYPL